MLNITEQFSLANHVPDILIWSVFTALLSLLLDFCFRAKNIFHGWLEFWAEWWLDKNKPDLVIELSNKTDEQIEIETNGKYETLREYAFSKVEWFWFKPLGGCIVCMNPWISFAFILSQTNFISMLAFVILSNFLTRFANDKLLS